MTRRLPHVAVGILVLLAWAQPAQASIWDLLEQLSGPGLFDGRGNVLLSGACLAGVHADNAGVSEDRLRLFGLPPAVKWPATPCFFFDLRRLHADADDRFSDVDARAYEFGVTFPIRRPIEVGAGLGWIHFDSKGVKKNQFAGTPVRVVLKPLLFVPKWQKDAKYEWMGFVKYYVKMTVISGMAGQDFGVSNTVFDERNKYSFLTSAGFIVDALELIGRFR